MNIPRTVAVTGASGLLGRPLMELLDKDERFQAAGVARTRHGGPVKKLDITDKAALDDWLSGLGPSVLIHLAAERRPDVYATDPDAADRLNIGATRDIAAICHRMSVPMLFLSTNYVFDGSEPPYSPDDAPNPLNDYGKSKRDGEKITLAASPMNRVLRVPMLYGPSGSLEESSVTQVALSLVREKDSGRPVALDVRQLRYPAYTPDVAAAILGILEDLMIGSLPGRYLHFCPGPDEALTKRDMGEIMASLVGAHPGQAVADETPPSGAKRPGNVRMVCPVLEAKGLLATTPFREAVAITMESIRSAGGLV